MSFSDFWPIWRELTRPRLETWRAVHAIAPTDAVFAEIEAEDPVAFGALLNDLDGLRALLLYHVVTDSVSSHQLYALDRVVAPRGYLSRSMQALQVSR